jgi:hypothetical protein
MLAASALSDAAGMEGSHSPKPTVIRAAAMITKPDFNDFISLPPNSF